MGDTTKIMSMYDQVSEALGTYQQSDKERKAKELFAEQIELLTDPLPSQREIIRDPRHKVKSFAISGAMMMFLYNPMNKGTLPYYDRFPLVIPIKAGRSGAERTSAGAANTFLALNLHYLDYYDRANLLDMIQVLGSAKSVRLNRISYDFLAQVRKYRAFRACVRTYRMDKIMTNMAVIPRNSWDTAIFLPIEEFRIVRNRQAIWKESKRIYRKNPKKPKRK